MTAATNPRRLVVYTGGPGTGKTAALIKACAALDPAEREKAAFLTVSARALREAERRLGGVASAVPRFFTLPQIVREVLRVAGREPERILTEPDRFRLIAAIIAREADRPDAPDRLRAWKISRRSVAEDVAAILGLLQQHRVTVEEFRHWADNSHHADLFGPVAHLCAATEDALRASRAWTFDSLGLLALQTLEEPGAPPGLPRHLFVDDAQELDALQTRIVAALAGPNGSVTAAVDTVQRTQMYRGAVPDAAAALAAAMTVERETITCTGGRADGDVTRLAGRFGFEGARAASPTLAYLAARSFDDEVALMARLLRERTGRRVVITRSNAAADELRDRLAREGFRVAASSANSSHAARFLRDALTLLDEPPIGDEERREARARAAASLLAASPEPEGEIVEALRAVERGERGLPATVEGWLADAPPGPLSARVHWLCAASRWLHHLPEESRDATARAYTNALATLMGLEETRRISLGEGAILHAEEALGDLRAILDDAAFPHDEASAEGEAEPSGDIVDVLPVHQTAGCHWDHAIVTELRDGRFPLHSPPSPFFTDDAADALRAWLEGREERAISPGRFERRAEEALQKERRLFLTAITRARGTVTLACHLQEADRPVSPSWFFQCALPDDMALGHRFQPDNACLLRDTLPVREGGMASCDACPVRPCGGRPEGEGAPGPVVLEETVPTAPMAPDDAGPAALNADWPLSASALANYWRCPRLFFLENVLRLRDVENDAMAAGTALHDALQRFHSRPPENRTPKALLTAVKETFQRKETLGRFSSRAAILHARRGIERVLPPFLTGWPHAGKADLLLEESFDIRLPDSGGDLHGFAGRMDFVAPVEGGHAIVDFKSGGPKKAAHLLKAMPAPGPDGAMAVPNDASAQLPLYVLAARCMNLSPVTVAHQYIPLRTFAEASLAEISIGETGDKHSDRLTEDHLAAIATFLAGTARTIKATARFAPEPSSGECTAFGGDCPYTAVCDPEGEYA